MGDKPRDDGRALYHREDILANYGEASSTQPPPYTKQLNLPGGAGGARANMPFLSQYPLQASSLARPPSGQEAYYQAPMNYYQRPAPVPAYSTPFNMTHMANALPTQQSTFVPYTVPLPLPSQSHHQNATIAYGAQLPNPSFMQHGNFQPLQFPQTQYVGGYNVALPQPYPPQYQPQPQTYVPPQIYANTHQRAYNPMPFMDPRSPGHNMNQQGIGGSNYQGQQGYFTPAGQVEGQAAPNQNRPYEFLAYEKSVSSGARATDGSWREKLILSSKSRGPPRKPRQSGHALWVGNLPPDATVIDLKDHFSREATKDIQSLKLISKSSCAFVNYRTQDACLTAMARFHDSRFHRTRLVCRLRRLSASSPQRALGPGSFGHQFKTNENIAENVNQRAEGEPDAQAKAMLTERFFVLKSLTLQDLEISVRNGLWATQSHNETGLNRAFETAANVYLIFSANKSGEYFGYARMYSPITPTIAIDDEVEEDHPGFGQVSSEPKQADNPSSPKPGSTDSKLSQDLGLRAIPTPATEWAPRGIIIDDTARGTIFWEADMEGELSSQIPAIVDVLDEDSPVPNPIVDGELDHGEPDAQPNITSQVAPSPRHDSMTETLAIEDDVNGLPGNSFRLEWLSTRRLPFYRTRGLRNAWNSNREVKIARDGTELETDVGKRLLSLFGPPNQRAESPSS